MESKRHFYRTVIEVEVLSEDPVDFGDLAGVHAAITDGECVGAWKVLKQGNVNPKQMVRLLKKAGSEPGFFQLNDEGEDVDESGELVGRHFIVGPARDRDTLHHVCVTQAEDSLLDIYGRDDYEVLESFRSLEHAQKYCKNILGLEPDAVPVI